MIHMILSFFLITTALSTPTSYNGLRIVKTCNNILKDDMTILKELSTTTKKLASITQTQGDWWNYRSLTLKHIEATLSFSVENSIVKSCKVLPTATIQADIEKVHLTWTINFQWDYQFVITKYTGEGKVTIDSNRLELLQIFNGKTPRALADVNWNVNSLDLQGITSLGLKDWLYTVIDGRLKPSITLATNVALSVLNEKILKSYANISVESNNYVLEVDNSEYESVGGNISSDYFVILNYQPKLSLRGETDTMLISKNLTLEPLPNKDFDTKVCYSSVLFGETLMYLARMKKEVLNKVDAKDYPNKVEYYKSILPYLGNHYSDDKDVSFTFQINTAKEIEYLGSGSFLLPTISKFTIRENDSKSLEFLEVEAVYVVEYNFLKEGEGIRMKLTNAKISQVKSTPEVDSQGKFTLLELLNNFNKLINDYTIFENNVYLIQILRRNDYMVTLENSHKDEVCLLYKEKNP